MAKVVSSTNADDITSFIINEIVTHCDFPSIIFTNKGSNFKAAQAKDFYFNQQTQHISATLYYPQAIGKVEHLNGSLVEIIIKLAESDQLNWSKYLEHALIVPCSRINHSTGYSSFKLTYIFKPNIGFSSLGPKLHIPKHPAPLL